MREYWASFGLGQLLPVYIFKGSGVKVNLVTTAPWWDLTDTILNVNPLRKGGKGRHQSAFLSLFFYHQKVERRAHLCTSTYRVLVHFYLFTEGYFQYTVVQLYFVEIWYIEHIEEWGKCGGKRKKYSG